MAVFRVERNRGYTVMSNHHLRNRDLTLKAKGLLSQMLSLPDNWDYTLAGLSHINREKIDAIREAVRELEKAGYIVRSRERDEKGRLRGADYIIWIYLHWKIQHWIIQRWKNLPQRTLSPRPRSVSARADISVWDAKSARSASLKSLRRS